jgi:asparagine synthase (glutamine-hydrolysing)
MPGIVGIIHRNPKRADQSALDLMVKCMLHEGYYTSGTFLDEQLGLSVGWVAHPGFLSDGMPVWNQKRDVALFFSGEDYSGGGEESAGADQPQRGSYLVDRYEKSGSSMLEKLNGWFSGLFIDLRQRKIVLFIDRYGLNRIYYHEAADGLYFSTEAKSLLEVIPGLRQLDYQSLGEFFSCGCALQNRTLFAGVSLLPGGSVWTYSAENGELLNKETYFAPQQWEMQAPLSEGEYYRKLKETWAGILPRYVRSEEQAALSLTGGLDSRMILAWADRPPRSLPCYSFGGKYRDCEDVKLAREIARVTEQPHKVIPVGQDFLKEFPALAEKTVYISDGAMDVIGSVELFVNRLARQIAPVRLTGNYGGEILRGHVAFRPHALNNHLFDPELQRSAQAGAAVYAAESKVNPVSFIAFKQVPWFHRARLTLEQSQLTVRSPYLDNDLVALAYRGVTDPAGGTALALRLVAEGNAHVGRIATDRGLEFRAIPFWTAARHNFMEFTFKAEYAYDYGMPQFVALIDHRLAALRLERLFLGRHKFYHFRIWYRDQLSSYVKEMLLDERTLSRPYWTRRYVEKVVGDHLRGVGNYTLEIHQMLTCELIQRQLIERK